MSVIYFGEGPPLLRDLEAIVKPTELGAKRPAFLDEQFRAASLADHKARVRRRRVFPLVTSGELKESLIGGTWAK